MGRQFPNRTGRITQEQIFALRLHNSDFLEHYWKSTVLSARWLSNFLGYCGKNSLVILTQEGKRPIVLTISAVAIGLGSDRICNRNMPDLDSSPMFLEWMGTLRSNFSFYRWSGGEPEELSDLLKVIQQFILKASFRIQVYCCPHPIQYAFCFVLLFSIKKVINKMIHKV